MLRRLIGVAIVCSVACLAVSAGTVHYVTGTAGPAAAQTANGQDFEKRYDNYGPSQRAIIKRHVEEGLNGVPQDASQYDKAAVLNAYLYRLLKRLKNQN